MGNAVTRTQLVGNRMDIAHAHLIDRNPRVVSSHRHALSGLHIFGMLHRPLEPAKNTLNSETSVLFSRATIPNTDVRLDAMGQRIDSRCRRDGCGQAQQQIRVQSDRLWQQIFTHDDVLELLFRVLDDRPHRGLTASTRGGGNSVNRQDIVGHFIQPNPFVG